MIILYYLKIRARVHFLYRVLSEGTLGFVFVCLEPEETWHSHITIRSLGATLPLAAGAQLGRRLGLLSRDRAVKVLRKATLAAAAA